VTIRRISPTLLHRLQPRGRASHGSRSRAATVLFVGVLGLLAAACGASSVATSAQTSSPGSQSATMTEYVAGHWVPFTAAKRLSPAQWAVVDAYANFSSAALAVYTTRSVAALAPVCQADVRHLQ
jgi:hypothetical protein